MTEPRHLDIPGLGGEFVQGTAVDRFIETATQ